ncbi:poly [ADP-ribose] polymerase tankyrase-1-like isoform X5 [Halichondria panicea]|uniref:poly [ADP-ribose] polymerase tankyrase-1-like isoform X5 n=1 Tax=Halichondria panicea TaxID=6063 RepID=UPI00312BB63B
MGITVELWRARIGLFSGGRGSRPHSKAPLTKHQPLHFSDTVGTTAKVVQGGLLLLYILTFLSSQDKSKFLKRTRNVGLLVILIAVLLHSLSHLLLLAGDVESNPGPRMDDTLTVDDLNEAHTKLYDSRNRWFEIGQALHVDDVILDSIRKRYANDDSTCLREMLDHCLKSGPPLTWKELLNTQYAYLSLGSSAQPVSTVLQVLLDKYQLSPSQVDCQIQQTHIPYLAAFFDNVGFYVDVMELTPGEQTDVKGAEANQLSMIKCLKLWKGKNPEQVTFMTLLEMLVKLRKEEIADQICQYLKEDIITSLPTQSSIQGASNSPEDSSVSRRYTQETPSSAKWELDSLEMDKAFSKFVLQLQQSLETQIVLKKLTSCLMDVSCYQKVFKGPNQCLFRDKREELRAASDFYDVWDIIRDYVSYFSYGLIKYLTDHLGSKEDQDNLIAYVKEFEKYAKRRIQYPKKFGSGYREDSTKMIVKLDSTYDKCELLYLKQFEENLAKILKVEANALLLRGINEGCVQLVFEVPSFIPPDIFPLTPNQEAEIRDLGVIQLDCGDYHFQLQDDNSHSTDSDADSDNDDNQSAQPSVELDNESIAVKSKSSHSDSGYNTVLSNCLPSQTSSTVHTEFEIDLDADPQLNDIALRATSLLSGINSFPAYIHLHAKWNEVPPPIKLHSAVFNGEITQVRFLIEVLYCNNSVEQGQFLLHTAAAYGHLNIVRYFIEDRKFNPATESTNKETPLHFAALNGHLHIVTYLVGSQLVDPTSVDNNHCSPLHNACRSGNIDVVKYLMSEIQQHELLDVNEKAIDGNAPIHFAAESGNLDLIQFLLKELKLSFQMIAECDLQSKDKNAAIYGHTEALKLLLKEPGIQVDSLMKDDFTALHVAAGLGNLECVQILLQKGANPDVQSFEKLTPLWLASRNGAEDIVNLLISAGASVHLSNTLTPLMVACLMGHAGVVELLIAAKADIEGHSLKEDSTPLMLAASKGRSKCVDVLIRNGARVNANTIRGFTALIIAAQEGHPEVMIQLISAKAQIEARTQSGHTALHTAAFKGQSECVSVLLKNGASPNSTDKIGFTTLMMSARDGHVKIMELLIAAKVHVNARGVKNGTALHLAAIGGQTECVSVLLNNGANPKLKDETGGTALMAAAHFGHPTVVALFIDAKAPLDAQTLNGSTALYHATTGGRTECVRVLLKSGADANIADKERASPLMIASQLGHLAIVKLLVAAQADVNAQNRPQGVTALHLAVATGQTEIVSVLLKNGADPKVTDKMGITAMDTAKRCGHFLIYQMLLVYQVASVLFNRN